MQIDIYLKSIQNNLQRGSERTHYPAIKTLIDKPSAEIQAIIEEKNNKAGIPDFTVRRRDLLIGYIEAKDVGLDLNAIEKTEQIQRYRESLNGNLIVTNYLEFRWYVEGKLRLKTVLAQRAGDKIQLLDSSGVQELLDSFLNYTAIIISTPEELAAQMARLTKSIRLATTETLKNESIDGELHQIKRGFNEILLPDLNEVDFADMYSQTLSYGLFTARVNHAKLSPFQNENHNFTRRTAGSYIPATNPFLKRLFNSILETDLLGSINWAIDDLVQLLATVDMASILQNFGKRTRTEDAVVHFYETFLAAYDAALRKSRGVYYTPEPVVSFMVRAVDAILKNEFNLLLGLADNSKNPITNQPRVQILDPATGTGTFLYGVVNQIYQNLEQMGMGGAWNQYVKEHLLGRLFGFELLMAPYAIAHLKLGLQLQNLGYEFENKQRLGIYLTNTLDEAMKKSEALFAQYVAQEANDASAIKRDMPVMVVIGNPPYSVSSQNASKRRRVASSDGTYLADIKYTGKVWDRVFKKAKKGKNITELTNIGELLERYKGRVRLEGEKNIQPLDDDYIKFIRFAHHRIEETGYGIVAFITNHSYLNGLIHRGMREELLKSFDKIYVMDLHGNSLLKETPPDGSIDKNVFDIQQGVAILLAVKSLEGNKKSSQVFYYDLWGSRQYKYDFLNNTDIDSVSWQKLQPSAPSYFFAPKELKFADEYQTLMPVTEIFGLYKNGIQTGQDEFCTALDKSDLEGRLKLFHSKDVTISEIQAKFGLKDKAGWNLAAERQMALSEGYDANLMRSYFYRPFDVRWIYFSKRILKRPVKEVMQQMLQPNLALILCRQQVESGFRHVFVTNLLGDCNAISIQSREFNSYFPLYLYPDTDSEQGNLFSEPTANFSATFLSAIREKLGEIPSPEAIFYYAYAIFHSPTYRQRYAEFLKIDFPRLPLTSNKALFQALSGKGQDLVELHLMTSKRLNKIITKYPVSGDNTVTEVSYKGGRVYINKEQYFEGISPELWEFKIGGYQVLDKWLKERKKAERSLSFDEIMHYQRVVVALKETMQIMREIDEIIPGWPVE